MLTKLQGYLWNNRVYQKFAGAFTKALEFLDISGCYNLTDSGLMQLKELSTLKEVSVIGSPQITATAKKALREQCIVREAQNEPF